ncbi:hypothetical protein DSM25558_0169 [Agrobacterium sp. DSM 25558]|uniref:hypothetical protein n=1 Tax=Agrobacterium sp. DSM 25558 TaxID=1907665 RepID=UPI0009725866|nr:hypothetical protein [Agrobacterium sp. DSM 25558]SCX00734.1 hypothetical protein DSM25558_0169 [Agrobacterium sp. DSM 25558]
MTSNKAQVRLSSLFTNPALKAAFERAERDNGAALVVPAPRQPKFIGGAAVSIERNHRVLEHA